MDVISDVFDTLRFKGNVFIHSNFAGQWGARFQAVESPVFHCILFGSCWMKTEQDDSYLELHKGDVCFLANGIEHELLSSPDSNCEPAIIVPGQACVMSPILDTQAETRLLCGTLQSEHHFQHPLFSTLPEIIHVPFSAEKGGNTWVQHAGYAIDNAVNYNNAGLDALVDRLYEILFIQVLQRYYYLNANTASFYTNYRTPRINAVLDAIHSDPAANWSLDNLAEIAHMSRSAFTSSFREVVGMSPMAYLTSWRMLKARFLVQTSGLPLKIIAHQVGFRTQSGLNKAFKQHFGIAPKNLRK